MKIAFYGSSLLSSYWNGAATYYRGLLGALAERGWDVLFLEPDAFDRQQHRDIDPPDWAEVVVWDNTVEGCKTAMARAVHDGLRAIYRPGFRYARAGVVLFDLAQADGVQHELALEVAPPSERRSRLMQVIDGVNRRHGRDTLQLAGAGLAGDGRAWAMRQERRSPGYTTQWQDLLEAKA